MLLVGSLQISRETRHFRFEPRIFSTARATSVLCKTHPEVQTFIWCAQTLEKITDPVSAVGQLSYRFSLEFGRVSHPPHGDQSSSISTLMGVCKIGDVHREAAVDSGHSLTIFERCSLKTNFIFDF